MRFSFVPDSIYWIRSSKVSTAFAILRKKAKASVALFLILFPYNSWSQTCQPIEAGQSFTMDSPATVEAPPKAYTLKALGNERYDLYVNLKFEPYGISNFDFYGKLEYSLPEKVAQCYQRLSPKLIDSNGRSITLHLYNETRDAGIAPPPIWKISIQRKGYRPNVGNWPLNIDCNTIIHETLHLTGLVDEYPARGIYMQRAVGPADSVMSSGAGGFLGYGSFRVYPAHLNMILYPNCREKNQIYQMCASFAYVDHPTESAPQICKKKKLWLQQSE